LSKLPPIPPEQRSIKRDTPRADAEPQDRRDAKTGLQSADPGDADVNLEQQGRQANTRQNLTHQGGQGRR